MFIYNPQEYIISIKPINKSAQNVPKSLTKKIMSYKKTSLKLVEQTYFDKKFPQFPMQIKEQTEFTGQRGIAMCQFASIVRKLGIARCFTRKPIARCQFASFARKPRIGRCQLVSYTRKPRKDRCQFASFTRKPRKARCQFSRFTRKPIIPMCHLVSFTRKPRISRCQFASFTKKPRIARCQFVSFTRKPRIGRCQFARKAGIAGDSQYSLSCDQELVGEMPAAFPSPSLSSVLYCSPESASIFSSLVSYVLL